MHHLRWLMPILVLLLVSCGGDDSTGPENQAPEFIEDPAAIAPSGWLRNVVAGDKVAFSARAIDPDIEGVTYRWELVRRVGDDYELADDAGTMLDSQTAQMTWTVAQFGEPVFVRCTISDGKESTAKVVGKSFVIATALEDLVVDADQTLGVGDSPYVVLGNLTINAGSTLRLDAGVELQVRPDRSTGNWEKREITVRGQLATDGVLGNAVLIHGGYSADPIPGGGAEQYRGIMVEDGGAVSLDFTLVQDADVGLRIISPVASSVESCNFTNCVTGVQVERGTGTTITGVLFRENSTGLQVNSSSVVVEGGSFLSNSAYGVNVDATNSALTLDIRDATFGNNLQAHLRMAGETGNLISATVRGSNFLQQSSGTPAINLTSGCWVYSLDLRGNYWGSRVFPTDIVKMFDDNKSCDAGVLEWTDFDCGSDPEACDWSNQAW